MAHRQLNVGIGNEAAQFHFREIGICFAFSVQYLTKFDMGMEPILTTAKSADFSLLYSYSINGTNGTSNTLHIVQSMIMDRY
jgi:hypothetical protein